MEKPAKRRNSEKRKEKSRDAARSRRSRESEILSALGQGLPLPDFVINSLDKASVMRIVISYLKLNQLVANFPKPVSGAHKDIDPLCLPALDGFVMIISKDGDLVYISENVQNHLGVTQVGKNLAAYKVDLMGNSVYEFSHPCDHEEIREVLSTRSSPGALDRSFFLRLKCTITAKGRNVNLKSASYKVVHCSGVMISSPRVKDEGNTPMEVDGGESEMEGQEVVVTSPPQYFIAVAQPIPHPSNIEIPLDNQAFVSKHSLDMKFTYADKKIADVLGYSAEDLVGKSFYEFHHAMDTPAVEKPFKSLFTKGQCQTGRYRLLAKGGGYAWVVTQATVLYGSKGQKDSVVCVNFLASGVENKDEINASAQLVAEEKARSVPVTDSLYTRVVEHDVKSELETAQCAPRVVPTRPQPATAKVFAPKTKDMNKGYLMFCGDEPGLTILKDEDPEDLTHLAPTAGDVCVPLDLPPLGDMFSDFLSDSYCPLLAEDGSTSSCPSRTSGDPFFSYRDDSNSIHSPTDLDRRLAKSPDDSSLPSLCSPEHEDESLGLMCLGTDSGGSELDEDLCRTAPYIPLDEDLPLLIPAVDVMWASSPSPSPPPAPPPRTHTSALAQLLRGPPESLGDTLTKRTGNLADHEWGKDAGQTRTRRGIDLLRGEDTVRKIPAGPSSIERVGMKRSLPMALDGSASSSAGGSSVKRARSELLQHLMEPPPPRSHSVLMNLLNRVPPENLGALTEVLKHLCVAKNGPQQQRRREEEQVKQQDIRTMSAYLLQPDPGDAIPSLSDLSQRDCEVNAPVDRSTLLQGEELLTALDYSDSLPLKHFI